MKESIKFNNLVKYYSFDSYGSLISDGELHNVTAAPLKDLLAKCITGDGTIPTLNGMHWRGDGLTALGSFAEYLLTTCYSTRYNSATRINSIGYSGTYTATANIAVKVACLGSNVDGADADPVGDAVYFYSTNFNMACGSAGKIAIDWSVSF